MPKIQRFPRYNVLGVKTSQISRTVIEGINKQYRKDKNNEFYLSMLDDSIFSLDRPFMQSGIPPIDAVVGSGKGFPSGIVEIYGTESSGKTALVEKTIAEAQKRGWYAVFFASEYSLNYERIASVGVDVNNLIIIDADTIEDFVNQLKQIIKGIRAKDKDTPIVVGWDSIAATPTRSELEHEKGMAASDMGKFAQQISKFFRRFVGFLFRNKVCLLCINQTRTNMGQMYGNPETTPGGRAMRFYAWVRCRISRIETLKDSNKNEIGIMCELKTTKNKTDTPPFQRCKIPLYWSHGFDIPLSVWEYCVEHDIFEKKGNAYRYKGAVVTKKTWPKFYAKHTVEIDSKINKSIKVR
jgi:recombination protein RecA